ncbi:hypothetical protein HZC00_00905 [Candidatus Kaiserbacteria bacterium]|nr:hypothetical protein [Candidatus Kaiserbacteria bacterium]
MARYRGLRSFLLSMPLWAAVVPYMANAQTASVSEVVGLFNIIVGFMFVAAVTIFVGGIIAYAVDFGNQERLIGVHLMEWGVAILFVLVVFLGVVQFLQSHQGVTNIIVAMIVIVAVVAIVLMVLTEAPPPPKKEGSPRP